MHSSPHPPTHPPTSRYLSHFRSVHRGAYFAELRTTTVRKLLPESWGFLCPVHTPDGSPCGLLNHFTATCRWVGATAGGTGLVVVGKGMGGGCCCCYKSAAAVFEAAIAWMPAGPLVLDVLFLPSSLYRGPPLDTPRIVTHESEAPEEMRAAVTKVLGGLGMVPVAPVLPAPSPPGHLCVQLDGRVVGHVRSTLAPAMVAHLRAIKAANLAAEEQLTPGGRTRVGWAVGRLGRSGIGSRIPVPAYPPNCPRQPTKHPLNLACAHTCLQPAVPGATLLPLAGEEWALPSHAEVVHIPHERGAPYPGVYVFTEVRPLFLPLGRTGFSVAPDPEATCPPS